MREQTIMIILLIMVGIYTDICYAQQIQQSISLTNIAALQNMNGILSNLPQTRLDVKQERNLCKLQFQGNWRGQFCDNLNDEQASAFARCYNKCLKEESSFYFCNLKERNVVVTGDIVRTCSQVCFDSV